MRIAQADVMQWHRWFAWRPVLAAGEWVWLEWVERKQYPVHEAGEWRDWTYRLPRATAL